MVDTPAIPVEGEIEAVPESINKLESHPAIDAIYTFLHTGKVEIGDRDISTQAELVKVLNAQYPNNKIYAGYLTRLKKKLKRSAGGYMLKDGEVVYSDGSPVVTLPLKKSLEAIIQIGLENALAHPEMVGAIHILKAVDLLVKVQRGFGDADGVADAWTEFAKTGPRRRRDKKEVPAPTLPSLEAGTAESVPVVDVRWPELVPVSDEEEA